MPSFMLTTFDNPFDPLTDWDEWLRWDRSHGYNTNERLARVVTTSPELSDTDDELAIAIAIDEIVELEPLTFKKIKIE